MSADGTWNTTMNTPMGQQSGSMNLTTSGSDLTGTLNGPNGEAVEITDGTIDGNTLTWKAAISQPMPLTLEFSAEVDGDSMSGSVKLGAFGDATFSGERA